MTVINEFPVSLLFKKKKKNINPRRHYLRIRAMSDCRGKGNEIASKLSEILTLGLVKVEGFNTGWVDYTLKNEN